MISGLPGSNQHLVEDKVYAQFEDCVSYNIEKRFSKQMQQMKTQNSPVDPHKTGLGLHHLSVYKWLSSYGFV